MLAVVMLVACRRTDQAVPTPTTPITATPMSTVPSRPTLAPSPTVEPPDVFPTHVAFEPVVEVPVRESAILDVPPDPEATAVPLPQVCLRSEFADALDPSGCSQYEIELEIDPVNSYVSGSEKISYANAEGESLDVLYLRLFPNAPHYGGAMTVTNLLVRGEPAPGELELEDSALRIPLDTPIANGERITVSLDFGVRVPRTRAVGYGLFSYVDGVMALPNVYPVIPVYDDEGWNVEIAPDYGDDPYTDVASYAVRITAPPEMVIIASGACSTDGGGVWQCEAAPMRDFTLVVSDRFERRAERVGDVVVNSYTYGDVGASAQTALEVAIDSVRAFSEYFGPYPYTELDVVQTPSLLGGMEYPGLVVVKDAYYYGNPLLEWITAHEIAHQWWYAVVGSDQIDDPWLDESLTSYSTMLYYEYVYGRARAEGIVNGEFRGTHRSLIARGYDLPVNLPAEDYGNSLYWDVIYRKGPLYFAALREEVGDETFFSLLQTYYKRHRFAIATPESWLDTVEAVTGDRYVALYEAWIGE